MSRSSFVVERWHYRTCCGYSLPSASINAIIALVAAGDGGGGGILIAAIVMSMMMMVMMMDADVGRTPLKI